MAVKKKRKSTGKGMKGHTIGGGRSVLLNKVQV